MSVYLHDIPLPAAQNRLEIALAEAGRLDLLGVDEIPLDEHALGRVLAEPVWARISSPHYHASAMDGFAVRAADTLGAMPSTPILLALSSQAAYVDTGDPLPAWADAVIPIENVEPINAEGELTAEIRRPDFIRIRSAVTPWSQVRSLGEDIVATQLVLPKGHCLRPVDLGAIAACGHARLHVARRPRVAIIPTGTELVPIGQPVKAGDIIEYNSMVLAAQVNTWGGEAVRFPIVADRFELINETVRQAARDYDLVLLNAGSSAGSEDFSARVVENLGTLLVHGVAVRPGHPVILGMLHVQADGAGSVDLRAKAGIPIIGVPGYPVSAALTGEIFVEPLITRWLGKPPSQPQTMQAALTRKVNSPAGDDDYIRVVLGKVNDRMLAAPLPRGAGVITSLVRADGITILPRGSQGMSAGETVIVRLYRSPAEIERTIFAIGSHDITLDVMAQFLAGRDRRLTSANVGSLGGLVALKRGEAHLAGSHLFDPATAEYNLSYIREYLPGMPVKVITLVGRQQGLLVKKGNPKGILSLKDLARPDVSFVNRQRGAGTRVLLDYQLDLMAIAPEHVRGYNQEEYTHLAVAAAVSSGKADTGLGIAAAAQALDLDFVFLFPERYDLVIPVQHYSSPLLQPLLDLLHDPEFRQAVAAMPGYDIEHMGNLVAEL
jgi:putative molybdopterin biosynthesis protein